MAYTVRFSFLNVGQGLASVVEIYDGLAGPLPIPPLVPSPLPPAWPPLPSAGGAFVLVNWPLPPGATLESIWIVDFGCTAAHGMANDVAVRYVQELMELQGRNVIDVVSISHLDDDHYSLLRYLGAGTTITDFYIGGEDAAQNNFNTLNAQLTAGGIIVTNVVRFFNGYAGVPGDEYTNPVGEVVLAGGESIGYFVLLSSAQHFYVPPPARAAEYINTGSTMLLIFGGDVNWAVVPPLWLGADFSFLMTGDATRKTLVQFNAQGFGFTGEVKAMAMPHHGSDTSIRSGGRGAGRYTDLVGLLTNYTPNVGVVSAGYNHAYKHPGRYSMYYIRETVHSQNAGVPLVLNPLAPAVIPDSAPPPAAPSHRNSIYQPNGARARIQGLGLVNAPGAAFYPTEEMELIFNTSTADGVPPARRNIHCDYNSVNPGIYTVHRITF